MSGPTYLFHAESTSAHYWQRRPTTDTPPGPLPAVDASSAFDTIQQYYQTHYDRRRAKIIGAHDATASIRVINPRALTLDADLPLGSPGAGSAWWVTHDPVGDRYYLCQQDGATTIGADVTVYSCNPDGSDPSSFPYLSDMQLNTAFTCLAPRNDGQAGISVLHTDPTDAFIPATCSIARMNPDGSRDSTVLLPAVTGGTLQPGISGRSMDLLTDGRLAVMMSDPQLYTIADVVPPVVMGLLDGDTWTLVDDPAAMPRSILHFSTRGLGSPNVFGFVQGGLTADPNGGLWYADSMTRPEVVGGSLVNHYYVYRWTSTDGWTGQVGEWPAADLAFIAALLSPTLPPLRQWPRDDGLRRIPARSGVAGPTSRQGSLRRGPRGTYT